MRVIRRLVVALVVVAGLLVVADRVVVWVAQRTLADQVAAELASHRVDSAPPETSIDGFPFLTQVATSRYEQITLRLRDVGSGSLRLPLVELTANGVTASPSTLVRREGPIDAARVTGFATIGYEQVRALTGRDGLVLSPDQGELLVELPVELLGVSVTLVGAALVEPAGDVVRVRVRDLAVAEPGALPAGAGPLVTEVLRDLAVDVPLPPLPYGLSVDQVRPEPAGLVVTVSAANVPLAR